MEHLKKKYGLMTAIAMVVGIVIGSGVFFKAELILNKTGGNMPMGILAWLIGGLIMLFCSLAFAVMAAKYEYVNGVVDYAEVTVGKRYGYMMGWFMATMYTPMITSVLSWVTARYFCVLVGFDITGPQCMTLAFFIMIFNYALNALSPGLGGKLQVSTTVIKLIPLILMAVVGTIVGLANGMTAENFAGAAQAAGGSVSPLFAAIVATAFAYEGWIIATSINAELKNSRKNLPRALVLGSIVIIAIYICYYIGIAGAVDKATMMASGENGARVAFSNVFGVGGTVLFVLVVISCFGTTNGLMMGCTRNFYALAARNEGPAPHIFRQIDHETNMPVNSSILGLLMAAVWLTYFYGANLTDPWFGVFCFDTTELPIVTIYGMYIPIFIRFMIKEKELPPLRRFVLPALATAGSVFMVIAAVYAHGISYSTNVLEMPIFYYLIVYAVIMALGLLFLGKKSK